ncbi:hypothetical protein HYC85_030454 [Camellia sinensis]|uniref:Uncharacterized protein n=1 Tax=Camellia sinensis TaxID=4442 RepID=A0A7J7G0R7_CAMSI|nr:hypothetical protein HYC85_030454 [Camellia sinensis]
MLADVMPSLGYVTPRPSQAEVILSLEASWNPFVDLHPCFAALAEMLPLYPSDLVLEWYDLGQGVAHLGQDVAQLSQVLSFLAEVIVSFVAEVFC